MAIALGANSTHRYGFHVPVIIAAVLAMLVIAISIFLCYGFADWLARSLGKTAMTVIVRLSSFLLVCIRRADHVERNQCFAFVRRNQSGILIGFRRNPQLTTLDWTGSVIWHYSHL